MIVNSIIYLQLVNIFRIEREGENQRFDQYQKSHAALVGDRRLLFHGSNPANWIGILSQGLRSHAQTRVTPDIPARGIYFADISAKSIPFCLRGLSDRPTDHCMVLCEVEVGKKQEAYRHGNFVDMKSLHKRGHVASFLAGSPLYNKWCDAGKVHPDLAGINMPDTEGKEHCGVTTYSEWVVYDPAQIRQRYFFHFTI